MTTKRPIGNATFTFVVRGGGASPQTLPMRELAGYLATLAELFGDPDRVHFLRVAKGSAAAKITVDSSHVPSVRTRLRTAGRNGGPDELLQLREKLNAQLGRANRSAALKEPDGSNVLIFPGSKAAAHREFVVREPGALRGIVRRVGGKDDSVPVLLEVEEGVFRSCSASRTIARDIAAFYEAEIEVRGEGKWRRDEAGIWQLEEFKIADFSSLAERLGLKDTLDEMALVSGSGWNSIDDPLKALEELRGA